MAVPYKLYGGATRPDAISGLNPRFADAITALFNAAPPEVQAELGLNSAYRSPAVQQVLWDRSDKTGHSVARPGKSKHQSGTAADLWGFGLGGGPSVSQATKDWVRANAGAQGLYFPMGHEPWHIQLQGEGAPASSGGGGGGGGGLGSTVAAAVDPRSAVMAQLESNPWKSFTDAAEKRGGLVGEGSAGGGLSAGPAADPGIPSLETASANVTPSVLTPDPMTGPPAGGLGIGGQLGQLANLFKVKPIGQAASGQALPLKRNA